MLYVPLALRMVDIVAAPLMVLFVKDVSVFMVYLFIWRFCNAAFSYWKVAACAWVCDHDGGDREGMILGVFTMVTNLGRAVTSAALVLGLGWAGLRTTICLEDEGVERDACERDKIHNQPESLTMYLQVMIGVMAPLIELVVCLLTWEFPIRPGSQMLADICKKQTESYRSRTSPKACHIVAGHDFVDSDAAGRRPSTTTSTKSPPQHQTLPQTPIGRSAFNFEVPEAGPESPVCSPPALDIGGVSKQRSPPSAPRSPQLTAVCENKAVDLE